LFALEHDVLGFGFGFGFVHAAFFTVLGLVHVLPILGIEHVAPLHPLALILFI
jgi:hypothetical protein